MIDVILHFKWSWIRLSQAIIQNQWSSKLILIGVLWLENIYFTMRRRNKSERIKRNRKEVKDGMYILTVQCFCHMDHMSKLQQIFFHQFKKACLRRNEGTITIHNRKCKAIMETVSKDMTSLSIISCMRLVQEVWLQAKPCVLNNIWKFVFTEM